jgi:hypothetical protein
METQVQLELMVLAEAAEAAKKVLHLVLVAREPA